MQKTIVTCSVLFAMSLCNLGGLTTTQAVAGSRSATVEPGLWG